MFVRAGLNPAPADKNIKPISSISRIWVFLFLRKAINVKSSNGIRHNFFPVKEKKRQLPVYLLLVGTLGAVVFVFSCFPIPVIALNGMATSHPCGTGMSAVLLGPFVSVLVAAI